MIWGFFTLGKRSTTNTSSSLGGKGVLILKITEGGRPTLASLPFSSGNRHSLHPDSVPAGSFPGGKGVGIKDLVPGPADCGPAAAGGGACDRPAVGPCRVSRPDPWPLMGSPNTRSPRSMCRRGPWQHLRGSREEESLGTVAKQTCEAAAACGARTHSQISNTNTSKCSKKCEPLLQIM